MTRRPAVLLAALLLLGTAPPASAVLRAGASAQADYATDTLQPPPPLVATTTGTVTCSAMLTWTPTPSSYATGYTLQRYRNGALESTTALPATSLSATQSLGTLVVGTVFEWRLVATYRSWSSAASSTSHTILAGCL